MARKNDEVEIPSDDYEIVPLTPLRRLEKRLEAIETTKSISSLEKFIDKAINMVELNQKIIDEVVRSNQGLREDIGVLVGKLDNTQTKISELVDIIKEAGEEEDEGHNNTEAIKGMIMPLLDKMESMNQKSSENSTAIAEALTHLDKRMKRIQGSSGARPATNILARRREPEMPEGPGGMAPPMPPQGIRRKTEGRQ